MKCVDLDKYFPTRSFLKWYEWNGLVSQVLHNRMSKHGVYSVNSLNLDVFNHDS